MSEFSRVYWLRAIALALRGEAEELGLVQPGGDIISGVLNNNTPVPIRGLSRSWKVIYPSGVRWEDERQRA